MKKITLLSLILFLIVQLSYSQKTNRQKAEDYLNQKGEVCFRFKANSPSQFKELSTFLSLGHREVDINTLEVEAYANRETFNKFLQYGLSYQVNLSDNELQFNPHEAGKSALSKGGTTSKALAWDTTWDAYPTYSEYVAKMNYYATTFSSICSIQSIGTTQNGRELLVLKISDNVGTKEAEPEFFYTSSMHGDELAGYPLMLRLIDYLLNNYGSDTEVDNIVNNTEIYINPLANPDGTYGSAGSNTIGSPTRANASGQDLNRNYPDNENIGRINSGAGNTSRLHVNSTGGVYEEETKAFMNFEATKNFVLSANFHGGVELMNYPYDNTYTEHADHDYYEHISVEYANQAQNDSDALGDFTYMTVDYDSGTYPSPGVTHGATWYVVYGGRQDYMNYYRHGNEITVELSDTKYLPGSSLPNYWTYNKQAFLNYMKQVNNGIHGIVTNTQGEPVVAKVFISGHDNKNSWVTSNEEHGDYYRLIKSGTYNVTFEAAGYVSQTVSISVTDNAKTTRNITMVSSTPEPTVSDVSTCISEPVTINASGSGTINWYENINDITPTHTGASYTTPALASTTSYFVEDDIVSYNVGSTNNNTNGTFSNGTRYLIFDTSEITHLKQVTVNANQAGEFEIQIQDSSGNMIDSRVILISSAGVQTVDLDFIIPIGNDLRLTAVELSSGFSLWRNTSGLTYPYTNGSVSIKNSSDGTGSYSYFHNWLIQGMKSSRKEVVVTVIPSASVPTNIVASNIGITSSTISWDPTGSSYDYRYRVVGSPTWTTVNTSNVSEDLTSLTLNTQYEVQVRSNCGGSSSSYSSSTNFTTLDCTAPANIVASNITATSATINWDSTSSSSYDYRYRVVGSPTWTTVNTTNTSENLTSLTLNTQYEVQVRSNCGGSSSSYSSSTNFTTLNTVTLHEGYFETGLDNWTLGGSDAFHYSESANATSFSYENDYSLRIRDNSGTASSITSETFDLTTYSNTEISFYYYPNSMEAGEDFFLQFFNGSTWQTIKTYTSGTDFNNGSFYSDNISLDNVTYNFTGSAQFRFQCDASGNNDQIYIDQVIITGTVSCSKPADDVTNAT
ncbi:M14 family zinc carboxypeptidase, partial [Jejuia spongiicola]